MVSVRNSHPIKMYINTNTRCIHQIDKNATMIRWRTALIRTANNNAEHIPKECAIFELIAAKTVYPSHFILNQLSVFAHVINPANAAKCSTQSILKRVNRVRATGMRCRNTFLYVTHQVNHSEDTTTIEIILVVGFPYIYHPLFSVHMTTG